jgi:hypothetical protein
MADLSGSFTNQWTFRELSGTSPQDQIGSQHFDAEGGNPPLKDGISYAYDGNNDSSNLDTNVSGDFFDVGGSADWTMITSFRNHDVNETFSYIWHGDNGLNDFALRFLSPNYMFLTSESGSAERAFFNYGGVPPDPTALTTIGLTRDFGTGSAGLRGWIISTEGKDSAMSSSTQGGGGDTTTSGLLIANNTGGSSTDFAEFEMLEIDMIRGSFISAVDLEDTTRAVHDAMVARFFAPPAPASTGLRRALVTLGAGPPRTN